MNNRRTNKEPAMEFNDWWIALQELAESKGWNWLLSSSKLDHHEAWMDGETPDEELGNQMEAARSMQ